MTTECIVGIDGSDAAVDALRWAVRNTSGDVDVVALGAWHVPLTLRALMAKRSFDVDRLGIEAVTGHEIDAACAAVGAEADHVVARVVEGHAATELLTAAADAQLLVVGRSGVSDLTHRLFGSVSRHCVAHAETPTVVVPPGFDRARARRVVVGFDGSENAQAAVRWALDFFDADASILVVAAIELSPWLDVETTKSRFPKEVDAEVQRINDALTAADPSERAEREVVLHGPKQALTEASGDADIIVLGSRSHGAFGAAMLGSVSDWMIHGAVCPVMIVPGAS